MSDTSGKGDKKRKRAVEAYDRLQRAAFRSALSVEATLGAHSLTSSQYGVLHMLVTSGPTHQQDLASSLGRSKAQMTAIIDALEGRELVRRERQTDDKRYITIQLTDSGRDLYAEAAPNRDRAIVDVMSELKGAQKSKLARLCAKLLRSLDPDSRDEGSTDEEGGDDDATSSDETPNADSSLVVDEISEQQS